jgi:hypothetical protein
MTKIVLCGALIGLIPLSAQDSEKAAVEKKRVELQTLAAGFQILGGEMLTGKTVKGAPYSAQAVNESVQVLADGNRITNSHSSMLYRDSQGRERREESLGGAVRSVFISDPMDGVSYNLEPNAKIAHKSSIHSFSFTTSNPATVALKAEGEAKLRAEKTENRVMITSSGGAGGMVNFTTREFSSSKADVKTENLGMQVIEGVSAEGTRTTMTIPAGQIGNEQPIVTTTERWFSSDLQTVVMTKRSDPRSGTTTYKLTNINRSEPAATLFQVPSDYTVAEPEMMRRTFINKEENQ